MNSEWKEYKLGDLATKITKGTTPSTIGRTFTKKGIKFFRSECLTESKYLDRSNLKFIDEFTHNKMSRSKLCGKDILFSMAGMFLGKTCIVSDQDIPANINQAVALIRLENVDVNFIYYYLNQKRVVDYVNNCSSQSAQPNINLKQIGEISINLPPLPAQKRIAEILSKLDDKIELNNKVNKNLEEIAQAIFKQWFVDFEFPDQNGNPYKSSGGKMIQSELGDIPEEWSVKSLDDIAEYLNGLALQNFRPSGEKYIPVVKIKELKNGISESSEKASPDIDKNYIIHDGDVLFSWSGSLEVVIWCNGIGALNQHLFKVSSKKYNKWFYYLWTLFYLERFKHIAASKATTMGHIKRGELKKAKVIVPRNNDLSILNELFDPIIDKIIKNNIEARTLTKTRDELLPKLMCGEIRV